MPSPDSWTTSTFEDGTSLYEAAYTTESRAFPMEIISGGYVARGSNRAPSPLMGTFLRLVFAPPIAVAPSPGQLTHLGILRIEITDLKGKGQVIFTQTLEHDQVVEQADVKAFRSRRPAVARELHSN
jgi:hypothetical protein